MFSESLCKIFIFEREQTWTYGLYENLFESAIEDHSTLIV